MIKLGDNEITVRCIKCASSAIHMSLIAVLKQLAPDLHKKDVYELSSRGPVFEYLAKYAGSLSYSEYFDDVIPGEFKNGVQCQNVEHLTYASGTFDLCTSTEVFEHVANDRAGFSEIARVLKPNGLFVFTVPIKDSSSTVERATVKGSAVHHFIPAECHGDRVRGHNQVLVFRDYGTDIVNRLEEQGFTRASIIRPKHRIPWGFARPVVAAYR